MGNLKLSANEMKLNLLLGVIQITLIKRMLPSICMLNNIVKTINVTKSKLAEYHC